MIFDQVNLLKAELSLLDNAIEILKYSYDACLKIDIKEQYTLDELDRFEAFTSRFARLSDIVIQKMFRLIDDIDLEDSGTVRDRINRAEKKNLIEDADIFIQIRIVRNDIAHEYNAESFCILDVHLDPGDRSMALQRLTNALGERIRSKSKDF